MVKYKREPIQQNNTVKRLINKVLGDEQSFSTNTICESSPCPSSKFLLREGCKLMLQMPNLISQVHSDQALASDDGRELDFPPSGLFSQFLIPLKLFTVTPAQCRAA